MSNITVSLERKRYNILKYKARKENTDINFFIQDILSNNHLFSNKLKKSIEKFLN